MRKATSYIFADATERDSFTGFGSGALDGDTCVLLDDLSRWTLQSGVWVLAALGGGPGSSASWGFETNNAVGYAGGFYIFGVIANDFSPALPFGTANSPHASHVFIVTSASPGTAQTVRVTGTSITDGGVRTASDTEDIVIPASTAANTYFETSKKWLGTVSIQSITDTPFLCNYGFAKYHDVGNTDFIVAGLECLWESDSTDSGSNIELLHHKAAGWTYNAGASATPPSNIASRSGDYGPDNVNEVGPGAWKRDNLSLSVEGSASEGILFRVTSGSTGIGSLSFRNLNISVSIKAGG